MCKFIGDAETFILNLPNHDIKDHSIYGYTRDEFEKLGRYLWVDAEPAVAAEIKTEEKVLEPEVIQAVEHDALPVAEAALEAEIPAPIAIMVDPLINEVVNHVVESVVT